MVDIDSSVQTKTADTTADSIISTTEAASFVDYAPPPAAKILPPAKYKLWLIVFVLVFFASWVSTDAGFLPFLRFNGWLSPDASFFLLLGTVVFVLVYSTMDLIIACLVIRITSTSSKEDGNKKTMHEYGVGAWLKQPRAEWTYSHENFVLECLARVVHILEAGFSMFDAPNINNSSIPNHHHKQKQFECDDRTCHRILKIEHRIRPDMVAEYKRWISRIRHAIQQQNGLLGTESTDIATEQLPNNNNNNRNDSNDANEKSSDEETGLSRQEATATTNQDNPTTNDEQQPAPHLHVIHVEFANIDYLNDWMMSPRRKALMKALEHMLVTPDVVKIQSNRALPDAFSDLLTRQGTAVPPSPPKKWKVWWLTLVALFLCQKWANSFLPYYFEFWGLTEADARLERLVFSFIVTFLNSYVMTPLFLFVFDHWLQHRDVVLKNTRQPWKTFDEGFQSLWAKVFITFAFYGGCVIVILVKKYA